ncbi:MAG: hypothetical protein B6I24_07385 [Bacteroidetes bacterium 4572_128]|nr:MAG: hypothetical protein B6I24_07385 [Bacteroidetes bacterium 4572_128]
MKKSNNFVSILIEKLVKNIDKENVNLIKFEKWFSNHIKLFKEEEIKKTLSFSDSSMKKLMEIVLYSYNEEQLKAKFIIPILNKIDFIFNNVKDWYEYSIQATVNDVLFKGRTDFMVADGIKIPEKPYFFIQEFKHSKSIADPENQLLAAMIAAIELNKFKNLFGCYVIGKKIKINEYQYFVHEGLNSLKIQELKQIFINLQSIKNSIKKKFDDFKFIKCFIF